MRYGYTSLVLSVTLVLSVLLLSHTPLMPAALAQSQPSLQGEIAGVREVATHLLKERTNHATQTEWIPGRSRLAVKRDP
jgi:hypothetical protein